MKYLLIGLMTLAGMTLHAQEFNEAEEEAAIKEVIQVLAEGWAEGDARKFAAPFTNDADFTVWFGLQMKGKEEIAFGHNIIFGGFYANTIWNLQVDRIRFLSDAIALVHASGSVVKKGEEQPAEPDAVPLIVMEKLENQWKIVAFQNTPFAVNEFRTNGDIRRMKKMARDE